MGECTEIPVHMTHYNNPLKNVTGSSIRVRGNPGGHFGGLGMSVDNPYSPSRIQTLVNLITNFC